MADAIIDMVGQDDLPAIADLYNEVYRPLRDVESFRRRCMARYNVLRMIARIKDQPVGFFIGFELKPTTFYAWFYGVLSNFRRQGIATQLMEAVHAWAREQGYETVCFECHNSARAMLHLAITLDYTIAGIRWDADHNDNLVIFEKALDD